MKNQVTALVAVAAFCLCSGAGAAASTQQAGTAAAPQTVSWKDSLKQERAWYGGDEAVRVADNVLLYQRDSGGWPKNVDMAAPLTEKEKAALSRRRRQTDSTIDNGATYTQLAFLAKVHEATKLARHEEAFLRGLDYLLRAQYENGGWPQFYPLRKGYYSHITFNDGAMTNVMKLLRDVARGKTPYGFVDGERRAAAARAVEKGLELILKTQVVVGGRRTVWAAQYDEVTLAPAPARKFEPVALTGGESVGIVRFLMSTGKGDPRMVEAVEAAVEWFKRSKIDGLRWVERRAPSKPGGFERAAVRDPTAGPIWARFYEIGTNRPVFIGRDGVVKYDVAEIEEERRNGYAWYVSEPAEMLDEDYPAWRKKIAEAGRRGN